ncbi:gephyrin-like molybdotransferase Glp [Bdellovibrionota bacterium FG-2]
MRKFFGDLLGDVTGAFADSAVLFPILVALSLRAGFSSALLLGTTGLAYVFAGIFFRVPMSVQPLKSIALAALAVGASYAEVRLAGAFVGIFCLLLCFLNVDRAASWVPRALVQGLQAGLGVILVFQAAKMAGPNAWGAPWVALALTGAILGLNAATAVPFMGLLATSGMLFGAYKMLTLPPSLSGVEAHLTSATALARPDFILALVMPQIVLTLANSVVATRDVTQRYFPANAARVTLRRLLLSIGLGNVLVGVMGGMPFCHGSGGVTAHVRGGAKTWKTNLVMGGTLLALSVLVWLRAGTVLWYWAPLLAALLAATGVFHLQLARQTWDNLEERPRLIAMVLTALVTQNMLWILGIGLVFDLPRFVRGVPRVRPRAKELEFMISCSYDEALKLIQEAAVEQGVLPEEQITLSDVRGRVCAHSLKSTEMSPPFNNSAMDGFAVMSSAVFSASPEHPVRLLVKGLIAAGDAPITTSPVDRSCAWEIMTGAPMPAAQSCDSVVRIEDVHVERDAQGNAMAIELSRPIAPHENVRDAGEDFAVGSPVVFAGAMLQSEHILALASLGIDKIPVRRRPRVAVISTGRELTTGQIRNSTAPFLVAALTALGVEVEFCGTLADEPHEFIETMQKQMAKSPDVIITTGAVSMGKYDFIAMALGDLGAKVVFHKTAIRPGKPMLFAKLPGPTLGAQSPVVFGLPGNPVATVVGLRFFVEPYLRAITGLPPEQPLRAQLCEKVRKPAGLRCFFKARLDFKEHHSASVRVLPGQASFMVSPLLVSNAWAILPEELSELPAGELIDVVPMRARGFSV